MSKSSKTTNGMVRKASDGSNQGVIQHHETYDDSNPLPDSQELAKLKEIDPDIINWLKAIHKTEQDARIAAVEREQTSKFEIENRKITVVENESKFSFRIDVMSNIFAFILIASTLACSVYFIINNYNVAGTAFSAPAIYLLFKTFNGNHKKKNP